MLLARRYSGDHLQNLERYRSEDRCCSKAEQKSLAAADVSQRLLIRRAKELIA